MSGTPARDPRLVTHVRQQVSDLRHRSVVRHFVKYAIVGAWNTTLFLLLFNAGIALRLANFAAYALAFVVASANSYVLNRHWTFRDRRRDPIVRQYVVFVSLTTIGLLLGEIALHLLLLVFDEHGWLGRNIAALGTVPVSVLWNFMAYRRWTFKPHGSRRTHLTLVSSARESR